MLRRTPSYPFRKPRDLSLEIRQRILDDEQKLALSAAADATRAKLAAEQPLTQEVSGASRITSSALSNPPSTPATFHNPTQTSQETTSMPQQRPEPQNEIKANSQQPADKKSPATRPAVTKNTKQYLRAAPKFLRGRPALARHSRKCQICRHPDRELIEDLYIHWHSANSILDFINSASDDDADPDLNENNITWPAIYRHAYALGLDEIRRRNLRFAFELLIEQAGDITPTSAGVIAASRIYSCISDDGRWSDPPKHVIVTNIIQRETTGEPAGTLLVHPENRRAAPVANAFVTAPLVHPENRRTAPVANAFVTAPLVHPENRRTAPVANAFVGAPLAAPVADASPSAIPNVTATHVAHAFRRHAVGSRQGTASAVPITGDTLGVLTPEAGRTPARSHGIRTSANSLKNKEKTFSNR